MKRIVKVRAKNPKYRRTDPVLEIERDIREEFEVVCPPKKIGASQHLKRLIENGARAGSSRASKIASLVLAIICVSAVCTALGIVTLVVTEGA